MKRLHGWVGGSLLVASLLLGQSVFAQANDEFESVTTQTLSAQEKDASRLKILEPAPVGVPRSQLEEFFQSRKVLSERQDDLALSEQFSRNWIAALPDDWNGYWQMAGIQVRQGHLAEYFPYAQKAVELAPKPKRAHMLAEMAFKSLQLKADTTQSKRFMAESEAALSDFRSLIRGKKLGQQYQLARTEASVYSVKAELQTYSSQYENAAQSATLAVASARRSVDLGSQIDERRSFFARNDLVNALTRQARAHNARGALFDADQSLKQGLETLASGAVSMHLMANLYGTLGSLRVAEGRFREAEFWSSKGVETMRKVGASATSVPLLVAQVTEQTAIAGQGRWREAWQKMEAVDLPIQLSPEARLITRNPLTRALVLLKLQKWAEAQTLLDTTWQRQQQLFGADHFTTALTEGLLAWALWENGKPTEGLAHFNSALPNLMTPQGTAAGFEEQGLRKLARKSIAEAYLKALGDSADASALARGFAMAEWLSGSSVQQALSDVAQRTRFPDPQLQELLRSEQDIQRELDVLYRYMNQQSTQASDLQTPQVADQMRQRVAQLSQQRQQLHLQIRKAFPQYEQMVRPHPPTVKEIAAQLGDDEVFVQTLSTSLGTYVWAIDRQHGVVGAHSALTEVDVAKLVQSLRATLDVAGLGTRAPTYNFAAAGALYTALFKPLADSLSGKKHLIVSTSGALAQIPMAALVTAPYAGPPAQAPWLIQQLAISHVPGASAWMALKQLNQLKPAAQAFMGWGDPLFDAAQVAQVASTRNISLTRAAAVNLSEEVASHALQYSQIPALPETRAEVESIAALLKADKQKDTRFGKDAHRESVLQMSQSGQLAQRRVLVFATHGLVPGDLPNLRQPALALAANGAEDTDPLAPLLTLEDVLGLKLNADWVVLSACNTAAADGRAEEALSGLARGFFYAGSRSLLVTHWSVESDSASLLTTGTFAHQMTNPGARRAESLRQSMLKVMAQPQFAHPAFWAPYALVGEGGR
ncbi:MAG: CHAT domain-containing tetratricopeptide repeat protein [Rhodoferax sp.]|uniref:CHAT domain-containing protein n=1 Tax=Rhodoferax sp. TaxID=50421 RepID=UPI0030162D10